MSETRSLRRTMPSDIRGLYRILLGGQIAYDDERGMGPVMDWIHNEGPRLGYRVRNPEERARATGRAQYFAARGLSDVQLYNAVGNHFDPDALRIRMKSLGWHHQGRYAPETPVPDSSRPVGNVPRSGTRGGGRGHPNGTIAVSSGPRQDPDCRPQPRKRIRSGPSRKGRTTNRGRTRPPSAVTMNACTSLWALLLQPQSSDLLPLTSRASGPHRLNRSANGPDPTSATPGYAHQGHYGPYSTKLRYPTVPRGPISLRNTRLKTFWPH